MTVALRALLAVIALVMPCPAAFAASGSSETLALVVQLATDPATMKSDRDRSLKSVSFLGGTPNATFDKNRAVYAFEEGNETHAQVVLDRAAQGWQLQSMTLLFDGTVDAIKLSELRTALTKAFGTPKDATIGQGSNTVLIWRGSDRVVRVTADVAGTDLPLVYVVAISRL